jgi:hypothetical protein
LVPLSAVQLTAVNVPPCCGPGGAIRVVPRSNVRSDSSADRQRLGRISKQGNALLRYLLVEAAQAATRCNPDWRRRYLHLAMRRERSIAKVAMGRRLAVRLYLRFCPLLLCFPFLPFHPGLFWATNSRSGSICSSASTPSMSLITGSTRSGN